MEEKKILENEELAAANGGECNGIFIAQDRISLPDVKPVASVSVMYARAYKKSGEDAAALQPLVPVYDAGAGLTAKDQQYAEQS